MRDRYDDIFEHEKVHDIDICTEECAELIQALSKYKRAILNDKTLRNKKEIEYYKSNVVEEMSDVYITIYHCMDSLGISNDDITEVINLKMNRLNEILKGGGNSEKND